MKERDNGCKLTGMGSCREEKKREPLSWAQINETGER